MPCSKCKQHLSKKELNYSVKHYGKVLCRDCQKQYTPLEHKHEGRKDGSTKEAIKLFEVLVKMGFNAQLEKYDGHKHIDIAIPDKKVDIEVDGMQHVYSKKQALSDLKRTFYSWKKGYVTLRIPNKLIEENAYETAGYIKKFLEVSAEQLEKEEL
jgi:very-short-patch-repair endonuclease